MGSDRMNGLKLNRTPPSVTAQAKGLPNMVSNMGNLGATVTPLKASNNPGPMTAPSSQGPVDPKAKQATGVTPKV